MASSSQRSAGEPGELAESSHPADLAPGDAAPAAARRPSASCSCALRALALYTARAASLAVSHPSALRGAARTGGAGAGPDRSEGLEVALSVRVVAHVRRQVGQEVPLHHESARAPGVLRARAHGALEAPVWARGHPHLARVVVQRVPRERHQRRMQDARSSLIRARGEEVGGHEHDLAGGVALEHRADAAPSRQLARCRRGLPRRPGSLRRTQRRLARKRSLVARHARARRRRVHNRHGQAARLMGRALRGTAARTTAQAAEFI